MFDILNYLPIKRKQTPSGWISFNCPLCNERRARGGLKIAEQNWSYHCFNCGGKASFVLGKSVTYRVRSFLNAIGVPEAEIDQLNIESLRHRSVHGILDDRARVANALTDVQFEEFDDFPPASEIITPDMPLYWNYLRSRHVPQDFPAMTSIRTDGIHWVRPHVTIPFTYDGKIVGWTARMIDNKTPKFISHSQPGYVFGSDFQHDDWKYSIVVEGIFDALCIDGLAVMHNAISDAQARLIRNLGKEVIVVPDQDQAGLALIDRAIELGWAVSIPNWEECKDVNDAVKKYSRLGTILSIIESKETSRIKIELRKKNLVKRLRN
jgi:transcription elongation factor Elf1